MTIARLLLDTHIALWWFAGNPRLGDAERADIARGECWLSAVSVWEVAIKCRLGKLPVAPDAFLAAARRGGFRLLSVTADHAVATVALPPLHADPLDRLLVAQAQAEQITLLTADATVAAYGANIRCIA